MIYQLLQRKNYVIGIGIGKSDNENTPSPQKNFFLSKFLLPI